MRARTSRSRDHDDTPKHIPDQLPNVERGRGIVFVGVSESMIALVTAVAMIGAPVTPGAHYDANWLFRFFFGSQWRDAWTAQIEAPALDLHTLAGGRAPDPPGGGLPTTNIHFKSGRGNRWVFRAIDKDPTRILDPDTAQSV